MPLSEQEKRALRAIEATLRARDPSLAALLSSVRPARLGLWPAVGLGLVGFAVVMAGLVLANGVGDAIAVAGYLLIVVSADQLNGSVRQRHARRVFPRR